ncbi:MAG: 4-alpha-glucanotransferase [Synechococcaceae cyanobacterium RL_1_2]|nr:4-alpha-glucanotransferase [Synechococcaceae cyanobacterium RL_1_2]
MTQSRASGVLIHPTSLPGKYGIGDLGEQAYKFIDFLIQNYQKYWQILPLGPTSYGNSPYFCYSAFAGNPLLINLEWIASEGLIEQKDLDALPDYPEGEVDFDLVISTKLPLLKKASENFDSKATKERKRQFHDFCHKYAYWLEDYALFMALKEHFGDLSWNAWEPTIANREPAAIAEWKEKLADLIYFHKWAQSEFFRQWTTLKSYANENGVEIFGDIPIYVAHDSADVWANPEIFRLNKETKAVKWMAGVPPDYFSETGQLWGNPVYNWRMLKRTNFDWWLKRVEAILDYVDLIRIDHFRGFDAFWAVMEGEKTAMNGRWIGAKGREFFEALDRKLGKLPVVAEDLGVITPGVEALRDDFGFPGMKILQFAFDSDRENVFLPFNYDNHHCVVYTGTHDNDTTVGWFNQRTPEEQAKVVNYLGGVGDEGIHWALIRLAMGSVASICVTPMQDLMGLDENFRMNTPGTASGNWSWRYTADQLTEDIGQKIKYMTYVYGRAQDRDWVENDGQAKQLNNKKDLPIPILKDKDKGGKKPKFLKNLLNR